MQVIEYREVGEYSSFVLGGDLGGTNTKLGIAGIKDNVTVPLFMTRFRTQEIDSLVPAIEQTLDYAKQKHGIETDSACFGAAGVVSPNRDYCKLTNAGWDIDTNYIKQKIGLKSARILNDFEAIGYGINLLDTNNGNDLLRLKPDIQCQEGTKALMGAGTGVGKSILLYRNGTHIPIASEGGHMDFGPNDQEEMALF